MPQLYTKLAYDLIWYESMYWYSEFLQYNIPRSLIVNSVWYFRIIYDLLLMPSLPKFIILELYIRLQFGFNRKTNMTIYTKLNWYLTIKYRTSRASTTHLMLWCIWLTTLWLFWHTCRLLFKRWPSKNGTLCCYLM